MSDQKENAPLKKDNIAQQNILDINHSNLEQKSMYQSQDKKEENPYKKRHKKQQESTVHLHLQGKSNMLPSEQCATLQNCCSSNEAVPFTQPSPLTAIRTINAPGASLTSQNFPPFSPDPGLPPFSA
jgi:hypothetical protein